MAVRNKSGALFCIINETFTPQNLSTNRQKMVKASMYYITI